MSIPGIADASERAVEAAQSASLSSSALGGMGEDAFLQLMVAQLKYQNPMQPSDPSAMMEQTSMFTQVEAMRDVLEMQQQLIGFQEVVLASSLVGKGVTADTASGQVSGTVDGVRFTDEGPLLQVGDREIPLGDTRQVGVADA